MKMEDLLPFITEALSQNKTFTLPITGTSMLPLLRQGKDTVELSSIAKKDGELSLKLGDLPLYRRKNGDFVLHRIVKIENNTYTMCGDNQFELEKEIEDYQLIGVVSAINKDGKRITVDDEEYVAYVNKMVKNISYRYIKRRLRNNISKFIRKNKAVKIATADTGTDEETVKKDILNTADNLISLLKFTVTGETPGDVSDWDFKKIKKLADRHRVTGFAAQGILALDGVPDEVKAVFKKELFRTAARYNVQLKEEENISKSFNDKKIEHCFLKGTRVAAFYDVPDSRFMLDMDVYFEKGKQKEAESIMLDIGYEKINEDLKDIAFNKKNYLNVELHKEFKYDYDGDYEYYKNAQEKLVKVSDDKFELKMTNEDFYIYILSHCAHHFSVSGTGIRSIIDHWYLRKNLLPLCNEKIIEKSLNESGLYEFNGKMNDFCDYWFGGKEKTDILKDMSDYVILSGIYGTGKNSYINGVLKRDSEDNVAGYLLRRFFPNMKFMKKKYKILSKIPALLPIMWIVRIFSSFSSASRIKNETEVALNTKKEEIDRRNELFGSLGL